jgi:RNA polymerase sigma factor (sigma-70 family)
LVTRDWNEATDAELLAACHAQEEPFAVFYRRHERLVAGWLVRRASRADVVGDLVAEVFAAAYVAAPRFRPGPQPAQAWLLRIARNKLLDSVRRERVETSARRRLQVDAIRLSTESAFALEELGGLDPSELLAELPFAATISVAPPPARRGCGPPGSGSRRCAHRSSRSPRSLARRRSRSPRVA